MTGEAISCVTPAGDSAKAAVAQEATDVAMEVDMTIARAGAKAPEFEGMAYYEGGFQSVKLSDYAGKWTVICFYPGDFTFV